jgi:Na+/H+ antiporter NhaD/arsenite permease-like protein
MPDQAYARLRSLFCRSPSTQAWKILAMATTFAGNLTILGSVANVIVVESARSHVEVGFWRYAKFGIPITLLTTVIGTLLLLWLN